MSFINTGPDSSGVERRTVDPVVPGSSPGPGPFYLVTQYQSVNNSKFAINY